MAVKKLIEVALPLEAINAASAKEKSIRHGHPSTLHLWWARRPLAAARAVIWASLVDDPSSHPEEFPTEDDQTKERERLFRILEELVLWENSNNEQVLNEAKSEIRKCIGTESVEFLDPFAGGGAIPLEALRLGLNSNAHDLNPVAVTINKAMIEIPPRFAHKEPINPVSRRKLINGTLEGNTALAEDVEYYAGQLKNAAYQQVGELYPMVDMPKERGGGKATVVAWLWARTVKCPNPACACEAPLVKSYVLSTKQNASVEPRYDESGHLTFALTVGQKKRATGTVNRKGAICAKCGQPIKFPYIREEGKAGRIGNSLMAVVVEGRRTKEYISADAGNIDMESTADVELRLGDLAHYPGYVNPPAYGLETIESLFTQRQAMVLDAFANQLLSIREQILRDAKEAGMRDDSEPLASGGAGATAYADAISVYLAFAIDKVADRCSNVCGWDASRDGMRNTFGLSGMSMAWDFAESNPFSNSTGCFDNAVSWIVNCIKRLPHEGQGHATQFDAQSMPDLQNVVVSTDPPYYSNVPYADFADFFYSWLRRSLRSIYPKLYSTMLTPKTEELVADPHRDNRGLDGARTFFEEGMLSAFTKMNSYARDDIPVTIYYAFKQSEKETVNEVESTASTGWETMLSAIIKAGFSIVGTWPMRTELANRTRSNSSNALASSIVLVCRKRPADAPMATRREFVNTLKRELKPALDKLQTSNIAPVDMAQSAIGPGIGVYSRFSKVLEADGSEMTVRAALQIINQELDLYFSDQDSDLDRDSRFCVDLYTQCAFNEIKFGEADVLARAKNTSIDGLSSKGALFASKGVVRLLGRDELKNTNDWQFTWLFTQQLTHAMETGGVEACAQMLKDVFDSRAENAKALAYRLFTIADKKGWNAEAFAYNSLVVAWPEIQSRAAQLQAEKPVQYTLFDD